MSKLLTRKTMIVIVAIGGLLGGIAWWQRKPLLAWHYVQRLGQADLASRESRVASVVALDEAAVPFLLASLESADKATCENLQFALVGLVRDWGPDDERTHKLLEQVTARFEALSEFAQHGTLQIPISLLQKTPGKNSPPALLTSLAGDLLTLAVKHEGLRVPALHLAAALVDMPGGHCGDLARELAVAGLEAADADNRVAAVELILRPPLRHQSDLLAMVVPLLKDNIPAVRKTALLALGPARELVSDDDLLPLLHDPDDDVQNLCALALRSRGLPENHILLARLISDRRPGVRLQVLHHLRGAGDLEPGVWLRRLCQDPAPAIRAAAVRAAGSQSQVDLRDCLSEMAQQDASPTVRQLAAHYLQRSRSTNGD